MYISAIQTLPIDPFTFDRLRLQRTVPHNSHINTAKMPPSHPQISTISLGMLILDDIHIPTRPQPLTNILGGSAAFVTLGERLFLDPTSVGCLVIAGHDFPAEIRTEIESWGTSTVVRQRDQPSSRGRLVYEDEGFGGELFRGSGGVVG